jgi:glycine/D-amino acid oxidase-like deaminating enzyme
MATSRIPTTKNWGNRPWTIDFYSSKRDLPPSIDFAVVGGGFTGLTAAAWLKHVAPEFSVALFEAESFGAGSSGHTGGIALAETAVGDLPGLGDVLAGYQQIVRELNVDTDLTLPGAYELGRTAAPKNSPIRWTDSGTLCAVKEVPGGTINPGKVVSGLARAADHAGVLLFEDTPVERADFKPHITLHTSRGPVTTKKVLFATNAFSLELTELAHRAQPKFTLAVATDELSDQALQQIGLAERKPFYTVDLPYLWGRSFGTNALIFGSGLLHPEHWQELRTLDINSRAAADLFTNLERRILALHPALRNITFPHRWGGPICIGEDWTPVFEHHPESDNAIVLGAFAGHGVAQSVYLGTWAADVLLGRRPLPNW